MEAKRMMSPPPITIRATALITKVVMFVMKSTAVVVKNPPNWAMSPVIRDISLPEWFLLWNLREKDITFEMSGEARDFLIQKGTNLQFGARPLRRAIERYLEDPLAEEILRNSFEGKNHVIVKLVEDRIVFEPTMRTPEPDVPEVSVNST